MSHPASGSMVVRWLSSHEFKSHHSVFDAVAATRTRTPAAYT
jgi:hypothetical protein